MAEGSSGGPCHKEQHKKCCVSHLGLYSFYLNFAHLSEFFQTSGLFLRKKLCYFQDQELFFGVALCRARNGKVESNTNVFIVIRPFVLDAILYRGNARN